MEKAHARLLLLASLALSYWTGVSVTQSEFNLHLRHTLHCLSRGDGGLRSFEDIRSWKTFKVVVPCDAPGCEKLLLGSDRQEGAIKLLLLGWHNLP